jgi:hypothetical protein
LIACRFISWGKNSIATRFVCERSPLRPWGAVWQSARKDTMGRRVVDTTSLPSPIALAPCQGRARTGHCQGGFPVPPQCSQGCAAATLAVSACITASVGSARLGRRPNTPPLGLRLLRARCAALCSPQPADRHHHHETPPSCRWHSCTQGRGSFQGVLALPRGGHRGFSLVFRIFQALNSS